MRGDAEGEVEREGEREGVGVGEGVEEMVRMGVAKVTIRAVLWCLATSGFLSRTTAPVTYG